MVVYTVIPALKGLRQGDNELEASLGYILTPASNKTKLLTWCSAVPIFFWWD
jgi:hypothetical protein